MTELKQVSSSQYDRDYGQRGLLIPQMLAGTTQAYTLVAGQLYMLRFVPSRAMTILSIAFSVDTAAGSDDAIHVGLYDSSGNVLVTSGAVTGKLNSVDGKVVTIAPTALTAGSVYYGAALCPTIGGTAVKLTGISGSGYLSRAFSASGSSNSFPDALSPMKPAQSALVNVVSPSFSGAYPYLVLREF